MIKINSKVTDEINFFQGNSPFDLTNKYGTPLYIYNEKILRARCKELKNLVTYENFKVNYSAKANSNLAILQIIKEEGLNVDAISPGELHIELKAGFTPENILYVSNNMSKKEMLDVLSYNVTISVDSLSQLEMLGSINEGGKVALRFNTGIGRGHHEKVVTGGSKTKFGINMELLDKVKDIVNRYNLNVVGINHHIGSLFMESNDYINAAKNLLDIGKNFDNLEFINFGGGLGIPYKKQKGENRLDLKVLGLKLNEIMESFSLSYGKRITFLIEPGRYIVAECGLILGNVNSIKYNKENKFIGTDIGFNVLARPVLYNSYHEIEIYRNSDIKPKNHENVTIVGNICESGDILVKDIVLPEILENDVIGVLDAGAYGYVMSSNYNSRLRPAEILIRENNDVVVIRKQETIDQLTENFIPLK